MTKQTTINDSLWKKSTELWNSINNGEEITPNVFCEGLAGESYPPEINPLVGNFLNYMCKHDRAIKIYKEGKTPIFVKVKSFIKMDVIHNTRDLLNSMSIGDNFTVLKFIELYKEKFGKNIAPSTVFTHLSNASKNKFLEKTLIDSPVSNRKTVLYIKQHQIAKHQVNQLSARLIREKMKISFSKKSISNKGNVSVETKKLRKSIKEFLIKNDYDLTKRLPYGLIPKLINQFNTTKHPVKEVLKSLRNEEGLKVQIDSNIKIELSTDLQERCLVKGLKRDNPSKESIACKVIIDALKNKLPQGGAGMIIGTPTAFCTSEHDKNNLLLIDNLVVALVLDFTTIIPPHIIIGDIVDPIKAKLKAQDWKSNNMTHLFDIKVRPVHRDSFNHLVTQFAEKYPLSKIILMTSGIWECCKQTKRKYGADLNYKDPSEYLTSEYKNLHILAMTASSDGFSFKVRYLHDGKNELLN